MTKIHLSWIYSHARLMYSVDFIVVWSSCNRYRPKRPPNPCTSHRRAQNRFMRCLARASIRGELKPQWWPITPPSPLLYRSEKSARTMDLPKVYRSYRGGSFVFLSTMLNDSGICNLRKTWHKRRLERRCCLFPPDISANNEWADWLDCCARNCSNFLVRLMSFDYQNGFVRDK